MRIEYPKRGMRVTLAIPASRPIKTLNGMLHEAGQIYKVLGTHGTLVRLSRVSDCAKLMVTPDLLNYANWIVWGRLKDGRFFIARGGCDYTGWDCGADNSGNVANTREELITFGMSEDERARFKLTLPYDDKSKAITSRGGSRYFITPTKDRVYHFPAGKDGTAYFVDLKMYDQKGNSEWWSLEEMSQGGYEEITFEAARSLAPHVPA